MKCNCRRCGKEGTADEMMLSVASGLRYCADMDVCGRRAKMLGIPPVKTWAELVGDWRNGHRKPQEETNGNGKGNSPPATPGLCRGCGGPIEPTGKRGRPPVRCEGCR